MNVQGLQEEVTVKLRVSQKGQRIKIMRLQGTGSMLVRATQSPDSYSLTSTSQLSPRGGRFWNLWLIQPMTNLRRTNWLTQTHLWEWSWTKISSSSCPSHLHSQLRAIAVMCQGDSATVRSPCSLFRVPRMGIRDIKELRPSQGTFGHFLPFIRPGLRADFKKEKRK